MDTAAALVEHAGRFLFLLPEGHTRMANMLEVSNWSSLPMAASRIQSLPASAELVLCDNSACKSGHDSGSHCLVLTRRSCMQVMKKMKGAKGLDARQRMLLDDAAFACVPPVTTAARAKARPPLHAYMRHLVLERLWVDDCKKASGHGQLR